MKKTYLFIIDRETGERKATYLVGIHGSLEQVQEKATAEYPADLHIVSEGEEMFNAFVGGNKLYLNGQLVDRPPYVPTLEEAKASKLAELKGIRDSKEVEPVEFYGHRYDFDTKSFERINAAIIALDQTHGTIGWTTADNYVVEVNADTLRGVIAAAAARSNLLHIKYRQLKDTITEANDKETVLSIAWE